MLEKNTTEIYPHFMKTDNENPSISGLPSNIIQSTDEGVATALVTWTEPAASDNSGSVTLTSDYSSGDTFPIGDTAVVYTATDAASNQILDMFLITIQGKPCCLLTCSFTR